MPIKCPHDAVSLPKLDRFVRRTYISDISWAKVGEAYIILTGNELFPINGQNSQDRLSVTFQIIRQFKVLPGLGRTVELGLNNLDQHLAVNDVPIP